MNYSELILRQKIFAIVFIILIFILTIEFIRRRLLKERYAILWLVATLVLVPLVLWFDLLAHLARFLGIVYPPNAILLTGLLFIILILFSFSVALSTARKNEGRLLMKIVDQEERLRALEKKLEGPDQARPPDTEEGADSLDPR